MGAPWIITPAAPVVEKTESNDVKTVPLPAPKVAPKRGRKKAPSTAKSSEK
jgi:hypothetical protein|tara:strand:+ start:65 stop:217 length:153 start_codon:yes stop_codon:yes gene_type:complete